MRIKNSLIALVLCLAFATQSQAQLLVEPFGEAGVGRLEASAVLSFGEIEYDSGVDSIERTIVGVTGAYGIHSHMDLYGELGFIAKAELENSNDDDMGVLLGTGLRGVLYREGRFSFIGRGGLRFISEEYGNDTDGEIIDVDLGVTGRYNLNETVDLYGGVDFIPLSEGEIGTSAGDFDFERDNAVGFRVGGNFQLDRFTLNAELGRASEEGFIVRLGLPL